MRAVNFVSEKFAEETNKYVFQIALPILLFQDISKMDMTSDFDFKFLAFCIIVTFSMFLGVWGLAAIFIKDKSLVGAFSQGAVRSSVAVLGVAFVQNICGNVGMAPIMIVASVPFFNILSVIILAFSADNIEYETKKQKLKLLVSI